MARGVKRGPTWVPVEPAKDPYPQHAKLYPYSQENWAIREFLFWALENTKIDIPTFDEINDLLLEFRGVDKLEYEAESADMRSKYRWLHEQFKVVEPQVKVRVEKVVTQAAVRVVQAALPDKAPEDGLTFLLAKIRGGNDGQVG